MGASPSIADRLFADRSVASSGPLSVANRQACPCQALLVVTPIEEQKQEQRVLEAAISVAKDS